MNINVGLKLTTVFISVASDKISDAPWVLGFPRAQLDEVIEKLTALKETTDEG